MCCCALAGFRAHRYTGHIKEFKGPSRGATDNVGS